MSAVLHWLLYNGIGQNVTASIILGGVALIWGWRKGLPRWKAHERRVAEIHKALGLGGDE